MSWEGFVDSLLGPKQRAGSVMQPGPVRTERNFSESLPAAVAKPLSYVPGPLGAVAGGVDAYAEGGLGAVSEGVTMGMFAGPTKVARNVIMDIRKMRKSGKDLTAKVEKAQRSGIPTPEIEKLYGVKYVPQAGEGGTWYKYVPENVLNYDQAKIADLKEKAEKTGKPQIVKLRDIFDNKAVAAEVDPRVLGAEVVFEPSTSMKVKGARGYAEPAVEGTRIVDRNGMFQVIDQQGSYWNPLPTKEAAQNLINKEYAPGGRIVVRSNQDVNGIIETLSHEFQHGVSMSTQQYKGGSVGGITQKLKELPYVDTDAIERERDFAKAAITAFNRHKGNKNKAIQELERVFPDPDELEKVYGYFQDVAYTRGLKNVRDPMTDDELLSSMLKTKSNPAEERVNQLKRVKVARELGLKPEEIKMAESIDPSMRSSYAQNLYYRRLDEQLAHGSGRATIRGTNPFADLTEDTIALPYEFGWGP